jgi:hypothetical protein
MEKNLSWETNSNPVKKIPAFYEVWRFITVVTKKAVRYIIRLYYMLK